MISERQGVEIDYCPKCRGVWLDRGEIDKLIDRESDRYETGSSRGDSDRGRDFAGGYRRDHDDDDDDDRHKGYGHKRKKKGLLSEMFEF